MRQGRNDGWGWGWHGHMHGRVGHLRMLPTRFAHTHPHLPTIACTPQCLALSPDETMLAAGDVSGRILIWRGLEGVVPKEAREGAHQGACGVHGRIGRAGLRACSVHMIWCIRMGGLPWIKCMGAWGGLLLFPPQPAP